MFNNRFPGPAGIYSSNLCSVVARYENLLNGESNGFTHLEVKLTITNRSRKLSQVYP